MFSQDRHSFQPAALRLKAVTMPRGRSSLSLLLALVCAVPGLLGSSVGSPEGARALKTSREGEFSPGNVSIPVVIFLYEAQYSNNPCACPEMPPPLGT